MKVFLFIISSILISISSYSKTADGRDLLNYFSETCPTQGEWTRVALQDTKALMTILENIRDDQDCVTTSGALAKLGNLQNQIGIIDGQSRNVIQIERLKAQESEILTLISGTTSSTSLAELNSALQTIQIEKAGLEAQELETNYYTDNKIADHYANIVRSTNALFTTVSNNQKCLIKHPSLLATVTSISTAVAASSAYVNPALGLGLAAATDFIGSAVENSRKNFFNRKLRKLSKQSSAAAGYKCVLESLSNRWCQLSEAESLLNFKASKRGKVKKRSKLKKAIKVFDVDTPVLLNWLEKVKVGTPASTVADADRIVALNWRNAQVQNAEAKGQGLTRQQRRVFNRFPGTDPKSRRKRWNILNSVIRSLTGACGSSSNNGPSPANGPLAEIYPPNYSPYYLLGLSEDQIPRRGDNDVSFCSSFSPFRDIAPNYVPNYNLMIKRYFEWVNEAKDLIQQESTFVRQSDPPVVLAQADAKTDNKWKQSVYVSLLNLESFIKKNRPKKRKSTSFKFIYDDTLRMLTGLREILDQHKLQEAYVDNPEKALEDIFNLLKLEYGTIVIQSRLQTILKISLYEYLRKMKKKDQGLTAQLLAADSFFEVLSKVSGTDNLAMISLDIKNSRPITLGNMNIFMKTFEPDIRRVLKNNNKLIRRDAKDSSLVREHKRSSSMLCLLLSTMPRISESTKKLCNGYKLPSVMKGGPTGPRLNSKYFKKNFSRRACRYHDYIQKSKIYQDWNIRL